MSSNHPHECIYHNLGTYLDVLIHPEINYNISNLLWCKECGFPFTNRYGDVIRNYKGNVYLHCKLVEIVSRYYDLFRNIPDFVKLKHLTMIFCTRSETEYLFNSSYILKTYDKLSFLISRLHIQLPFSEDECATTLFYKILPSKREEYELALYESTGLPRDLNYLIYSYIGGAYLCFICCGYSDTVVNYKIPAQFMIQTSHPPQNSPFYIQVCDRCINGLKKRFLPFPSYFTSFYRYFYDKVKQYPLYQDHKRTKFRDRLLNVRSSRRFRLFYICIVAFLLSCCDLQEIDQKKTPTCISL